MEFWIGFWPLVLSAGLFLFAALAVIVAIGAFFEARHVFRALARRRPRSSGGDPADAPSDSQPPSDDAEIA